MRTCARVAVVLVWTILMPAAVFGQASITGVVRDTSGAVLPGVTVEASSPALIEKVRTALTDGTGQYLITNLVPGTYTVAYTLSGFNTVKREGIVLTGSFTASVNVELRVGAIEETITVTGETPIVDVQSTQRQRVLDRQVLEALPSSRAVAMLTGLTPGVTTTNTDVGGSLGDGVGTGGLRAHGVSDARLLVSGVVANTTYRIAHGAYNLSAYEEVVVDTGGTGAEQEEGGVRINVVPRDGGNTFRGSFFGAFANSSMAGNNFTQDLKDRGLRTPDSLKEHYDVNPSVGGPIKRDKVWFNVAARYSLADSFSPVLFNKNAGNPNVWTYEPDTSRVPAFNDNNVKNFTARVTWQATPKNKLAATYDPSKVCDCPRGLTATTSPEGDVGDYVITKPNRNLSAEWTAPITSRFLLEANILSRHSTAARAQVNPFFAPSAVPLIKVTEQSNGLQYRGTPNARISTNNLLFWRAAASYVTGAHAFKTGFVFGRIPNDDYTFTLDAPIEYRFNNGVPNRLTIHATPFRQVTNLDADHGVFVQDKWTVKRLTLAGGLRYTFLRIKFPATVVGPGAWLPNRNIVVPETNGSTWHDLTPRSSLAVDVFGNGKTALKVSLNRYLGAQDRSTLYGAAGSPVGALVTSTNRNWTDTNRNFVPDCDLVNPLANGECGVMSNTDFGSTRPGRAYDFDATHGWGKRTGNWQFATGVQHQILPRASFEVSYWRTWFVNLAAIDARALSSSDFDTFSITAPVDPRLPGGGGYVVSGFYDIRPARAGVPADEFVTFSDNIGKQIEHWNGVDFTINARPRTGVLLQGGTSTERRTSDTCDVMPKLPEMTLVGATTGANQVLGAAAIGAPVTATTATPLQFCHIQGKFLTQAKLLGAITVPRIDVQVSASFQSLPGPEITATYVASNAEVARSLGRSLSANASSVQVHIVEPRSMYGDRMYQIDLRFGKILKFGRTRTTASLDLYNALNSNSVLVVSNAFATWQQPQSILPARFAKVVLQFDF